MVNSSSLDRAFQALADPTRRAILARLSEGEATVGELAEPFEISLPAVSKHLKVLEAAGLMQRRREGRLHHCRLAAQPLLEASEWLDTVHRFWSRQLDALAEYFETREAEEDTE